jgi:DNA-binding response OmpR family regulator
MNFAVKNAAARAGRVFSRQQLMEQVWGDANESFDRTVDTHIKTLRAKLRAVNPDISPSIPIAAWATAWGF